MLADGDSDLLRLWSVWNIAVLSLLASIGRLTPAQIKVEA